MNSDVGKQGAGQPRAFATTRWNLILFAAESETGDKSHATRWLSFARFIGGPFSLSCATRLLYSGCARLNAGFFCHVS